MFIDQIGLDEVTIDIYLAVARASAIDVIQLGEEVGVSHEVVHRELHRLQTCGLIRASPTELGWCVAEPPNIALRALIRERHHQARAAHDLFTMTRAAAEQLTERYTATVCEPPLREYERIHCPDRAVERTYEYAEQATSSIDAVMRDLPSAVAMDDAKKRGWHIMTRGVRVRLLCPVGANQEKHIVEYSRWLREQGGDVRTVADLPESMVLCDRTTAIVSSATESERGAAAVTTPSVVGGLLALFDMLWLDGVPIGGRCETTLTNAERTILQLLARGLKDESIARALGVSTRTVRRALADLSDRAGTTSRFALGVHAASEGWVHSRTDRPRTSGKS